MKQGDFQKLPIMLGTTADEGTFTLLISMFIFPSPSEPFVSKQRFEGVSIWEYMVLLAL